MWSARHKETTNNMLPPSVNNFPIDTILEHQLIHFLIWIMLIVLLLAAMTRRFRDNFLYFRWSFCPKRTYYFKIWASTYYDTSCKVNKQNHLSMKMRGNLGVGSCQWYSKWVTTEWLQWFMALIAILLCILLLVPALSFSTISA